MLRKSSYQKLKIKNEELEEKLNRIRSSPITAHFEYNFRTNTIWLGVNIKDSTNHEFYRLLGNGQTLEEAAKNLKLLNFSNHKSHPD